MGFSESDQHKFYDNDGHEVDFEYFWDEYEKWKTAQLLKAREESKQHHDWYEKAVNRLSELRQELERVKERRNYEIVFGTHLMARIYVFHDRIECEDAINGWGDNVEPEKIKITNNK